MSIRLEKIERIFLIALIVVASFLRLYRFKDFMEFLGDQGRDAIIAKQILVDHHLTLLGPGTSVGSMYLGPLYYYFMVPFLAITYPDPVGPALAVCILGILTVALMYILGRELIGKSGAAFASVLFAFSPIAVKLSRFSWQPTPAPIVGLIMLWSSYKAIKGNKWYWLVSWICFIVLTQLHYVALLSLIPNGVMFLFDIYKNRRNKKHLIVYLKVIGISFLVFLFSILPLVLFDIRHDHLVLRGFTSFFNEQKHQSLSLSKKINQMYADSHGVGMKIVLETLGFSKEHRLLNTYILFGVIFITILRLFHERKKKHESFLGISMISLWVFTTVIGLVYYRNTIYDHYYAFAFPAIFFLIGYISAKISQLHKVLALSVVICVGVLAYFNVMTMSYWNRSRPFGIYDVQQIVESALPYVNQGETYNIALLNDNREYMGMKYRYFFEVSGKTPKSQYDYKDLNKLIVIVENNEEPLNAPIYEVQEFKQEVLSPVLEKQLTYNGVVNIYIYKRP